MKFQVGEHVVIRGVIESVEDVGEGREVITIRHAATSEKFGAWGKFFERVGPVPMPPHASEPGPGSNPAAGTTIHIQAGAPVSA